MAGIRRRRLGCRGMGVWWPLKIVVAGPKKCGEELEAMEGALGVAL